MMNRTNSNIIPWVSGLTVIQSAIFFLAALFHFGVPNFTGIDILSLPEILPAGIVEASIGLFLALSTLALITRRSWARQFSLFTYGYALLGVFIGIFSLSGVFSSLKGQGAQASLSNDLYYHMLMLMLILISLALLLTRGGNPNLIARMLVRLTGGVQIFLGIVFWITDADGLIPIHIANGLLFVLSLWVLIYLAARAGAPAGWILFTTAWSLLVPILGLTQANLLVGPDHWIIQVIHLLVGVGAIGLGERLASRFPHFRELASLG